MDEWYRISDIGVKTQLCWRQQTQSLDLDSWTEHFVVSLENNQQMRRESSRIY
jgi:hypothetical protein